MKFSLKLVLLFCIFQGTALVTMADKGVGKKAKTANVSLNVTSNVKSNLAFNLKTGLKYTGSLISTNSQNGVRTNMVTYQKGNTIYIIPQKQKMVVPDYRVGYSGMKLIIQKS